MVCISEGPWIAKWICRISCCLVACDTVDACKWVLYHSFLTFQESDRFWSLMRCDFTLTVISVAFQIKIELRRFELLKNALH
jgi:hypothetical protein